MKSNSITITVSTANQAPNTFSAQIPATSGVIGTAFTSYTFAANGTPAPAYSIANGSLPSGLTLSSAGVLSGTPTAAGSYTFTVQASNTAGSVNSNSITITVSIANQAPSTFSDQIPATSGVVGTAFALYTFVANGTPTPTYSIVSGALPSGLTLSASGVLSGTPIVAGAYTFTVQASNSAGNVNSNPITITITPPAPSITGFSVSSTVVGGAFTIRGRAFTGTSQVVIGGAVAPYTVTSDSTIIATVPTGAAGVGVSVTMV